MINNALLRLLGISELNGLTGDQLLSKVFNRVEDPETYVRQQLDQVWPFQEQTLTGSGEQQLHLWLTQTQLAQPLTLLIDGNESDVAPLTFTPAADIAPDDARREADCQHCYPYRLTLPALEMGRHDLVLQHQEQRIASATLQLLPGKGFTPVSILNQSHFWGIRAQLSAIRSARNWGVGDLSDLYELVESTTRMGAQACFLLPLADTASSAGIAHLPYLASHRNYVHLAYLDVEAITEYEHCEAAQQQVRSNDFQQHLHRLYEQETVDWPAVCNAKRTIVEQLYSYFVNNELTPHTRRAQHYLDYVHEGGSELYQYCLYQALQEQLQQEGFSANWQQWPVELQQVYSELIAERAVELEDRIGFYQYLQWQLSMQLQRVGKLMWESSSALGLVPTLSMSVATNSAEVWADDNLYSRLFSLAPSCCSAHLRAPAAALNPWQLRAQNYQPLRRLLGHTMGNAGAVLLTDLSSLLAPQWQSNDEEATLSLTPDTQAIIGVIAEQSHTHQCLVIIDDQAQWSAELRAALMDADFLLYSSLLRHYQEQHFPEYGTMLNKAVMTFAADYEPTLKGFWTGADLQWQYQTVAEDTDVAEHSAALSHAYLQRATARTSLLLALDHAGFLPGELRRHLLGDSDYPSSLCQHIYEYLSASPARWVAVNLADLLGSVYQPCLPPPQLQKASSYKYPEPIERLYDDDQVWQITEMLSNRAPHSSGQISAQESPLDPELIPLATYRMQIQPQFSLTEAKAQLDYLQQLGISHLYTSPLLEARSGSTHGYDVTNHTRINPEIGGDEAFNELHQALSERQQGLILDIVPNHMVVMGSDNVWWLDVLQNGPSSIYADYFDIEWEPLNEALHNKVLIPVLGERYGQILANNELQLCVSPQHGDFYVQYYEHQFPVDPQTYPQIIRYRLGQLEALLGANSPQLAELNALLDALAQLPDSTQQEESIKLNRRNNAMVHKKRLAQLAAEEAKIEQYLQSCVEAINQEEDQSTLHQLLEQQNYRLAYWRTASDEINYRRFFDINELGGLRMENYRAFEDAHQHVFNLIEQEKVQGIRIDHSDGLADPGQYFQWLAKRFTTPLSKRWLYIVTEKILSPHELLCEQWPIDGTTGYDYLFLSNAVLVDTRAEATLEICYKHFVGYSTDYEQLLYENKKRVMDTALASELNMLAKRLSRLLQRSPMTRDYPQSLLRDALKEVIACFPVYRTYIHGTPLRQPDQEYIDVAIARARRHAQFDDLSVYDVLHQIFSLTLPDEVSEVSRKALLKVVMNWQQLTSPVMAKGAEDTSFYLYNRLVSLNEVGSEPTVFGIEPAEYHLANQQRARLNPNSMLCTSTHDTKRSEDVRCRISALSELADTWQEHIHRWHQDNSEFHMAREDHTTMPTANDCYLLYQTLVGTWPMDIHFEHSDRQAYLTRIQNYMLKAAREAKRNTSWLHPDEDYENALSAFAESCITEHNETFQRTFLPFLQRVIQLGVCNSLATVALKYSAPGVPDLYQGNELWDYSLVDPDNRHLVDYGLRHERLAQVSEGYASMPRPAFLQELLTHVEDGRIKLFMTWLMLRLRQQLPALFTQGSYDTLPVTGDYARHAIVSVRRAQQWQCIVVAPRLSSALPHTDINNPWPLGDNWGNTQIELEQATSQELINMVDGQFYKLDHALSLAELLAEFPCAVLISRSAFQQTTNDE